MGIAVGDAINRLSLLRSVDGVRIHKIDPV
jgi:hypothetical protein